MYIKKGEILDGKKLWIMIIMLMVIRGIFFTGLICPEHKLGGNSDCCCYGIS